MKKRFVRNIDGRGRAIRALFALALLIGAAFAFRESTAVGVVLLLSGLFVAFEATRGWCALRACGIRTKF